MPMAKLNSGNIYYEQYGTGDNLVLISGLTADHNVWSEMIESLSKSYRVLVFDNPGVGRSFIPKENYSLEMMSRDIVSLLDHLEIRAANFMGHSLGAAILMHLCIDQPKRVKKAILSGGPAVVPITAKLQVESLRYALEHNFSQDYISLANLPWLFGRRFLEDKKRLEKWNAKLMANQYPQTFAGFQAQAQVVLTFDLSSRLKEITTECLIVASDEDLIIPLHCMEFLKQHIPNSRLEIIGKGVGHMFHVEEPQQLSNLALRFFS